MRPYTNICYDVIATVKRVNVYDNGNNINNNHYRIYTPLFANNELNVTMKLNL